jgi:hypothetical protein
MDWGEGGVFDYGVQIVDEEHIVLTAPHGLLVYDLRRAGARNLRRSGVAETVAMKIGDGSLARFSRGTPSLTLTTSRTR